MSARVPSLPRLPRWILVWFAISLPLVVWDVSFVLLRPASMPGGSLSLFWAPYAKYVTVDRSYGDLGNGFVWAQAMMSGAEVAMAIVALWLSLRGRRALGTLLVFSVSLLTCAKTLLILLIEVVTRLEHVGHNPLKDLVLLYLVPNGAWVVMPALVAWATGRMLLAGHEGEEQGIATGEVAPSVGATTS
jgi:hypothetical protein